MSTPHRHVSTPASDEELRKMITESWAKLSVTVEFWPGPGRRIRGAESERKYTLRADAGTVLLGQEMTPTATGEAGICKMVAELREIFDEAPLPNSLSWDELDEFAHLADMRAFEDGGGKKLPKGTEATYRLSEIGEWLAKRHAAVAADEG